MFSWQDIGYILLSDEQDLEQSLLLLKDEREKSPHLVCLTESAVHVFWDNHTAAFAYKKELPSNKDPGFLFHSSWQIEFLLLPSGLSHLRMSSSIGVTRLS